MTHSSTSVHDGTVAMAHSSLSDTEYCHISAVIALSVVAALLLVYSVTFTLLFVKERRR